VTASSHPIRVVIADDHAVVLEGVRTLLEKDDRIRVVGVASDGEEAVRACLAEQPDVVLLDVSMPALSGLEAAARIKEEGRTSVLILSMHDEPEYVVRAVRAGADGYVLKDADPLDLRRAVHIVAGGGSFFPKEAVDRLQEGVRLEAERDRKSRALDELTDREREVLLHIARGRTNREIAAELKISPRTVETHRERVMSKTGVHTVAGLTRLVLDAGLDTDD